MAKQLHLLFLTSFRVIIHIQNCVRVIILDIYPLLCSKCWGCINLFFLRRVSVSSTNAHFYNVGHHWGNGGQIYNLYMDNVFANRYGSWSQWDDYISYKYSVCLWGCGKGWGLDIRWYFSYMLWACLTFRKSVWYQLPGNQRRPEGVAYPDREMVQHITPPWFVVLRLWYLNRSNKWEMCWLGIFRGSSKFCQAN